MNRTTKMLMRAKAASLISPLHLCQRPINLCLLGRRSYMSSVKEAQPTQMDSQSKKLPVALVQFHSASSVPEENQQKAEQLVRTAASKGAKFVLLPELYCTMLPRPKMPEYAETIPGGPKCQRWASLASELGIWLLAGSMTEPVEGQANKLYNTSVLFDDKGHFVTKYRKIHLFDVCVPGMIEFEESALVAPGKEPVLADTPFGKLGLSVCYDLRFPELFIELSRRGMDILCIPAAFSYGTGQKHWLHLLKARAIENQCFVLAPNQVGTAPNQFRSWGHSLVLDPWGEVLGEGGDSEEIVYATLDLSKLQKYRSELPSLRHRRTDVFFH